MIRSNTHAFEILETNKDGVPYEAIRYLYYQPRSADIRKKIYYWLENAYNEAAYLKSGHEGSLAPFWFAIIAEQYLEEDLIGPVIALYTTVDSDWDFLNEQGIELIHGLCHELGETAVRPFLNKILQQIETESDLPYLYLFDCLKFVDPEKYPEEVLQLLDKKIYWQEALIASIPHIRFSQKKHPELIAGVHQKLELLKLEYETMETLDHIDTRIIPEIERCLNALEKADYPLIKYVEWEKKDWEANLRKLEHRFVEDEDEDEDEDPSFESNYNTPVAVPKKVSRNAPCPCGSGKKYKRCCL